MELCLSGAMELTVGRGSWGLDGLPCPIGRPPPPPPLRDVCQPPEARADMDGGYGAGRGRKGHREGTAHRWL